jgi:hypothetical protein
MDLAVVYRTFHPTSAQYTFFSADHGTFSKIDHVCAVIRQNALKLELNNKNNSRKHGNN